jgi:hypothetical protein
MALPNFLSTHYFPDAYDDLVDNFTGTKKYIRATGGSDSNNGNSVDTAYATIGYALAQNTSATPTMFVILEGTYTLTPTSGGNGAAVGLYDSGNHREFVCSPGRVTIQFTANIGDRDTTFTHFSNTSTKVYGAIFKRNNNGRTTNYTVAYFKGGGGGARGNYYNCVFQETNANNAWSYQYDNYGNNNLAVRNCTIYNGAAPSGNYSNAGTCLTIDSVFNTTVTTGGTETNVLKSQTVNATTYETTGVTTAGVYSGTYSWSGTTTPAVTGFSNVPASVTAGAPINVTYIDNTDPASVSYTITGVSSSDILTPLTGNFVKSSAFVYTLTIKTLPKFGVTNTLTISASTFTANVTINPGFSVRYLLVAGGGGGGSDMGGGGGAGGYLAAESLALTNAINTIVIGAGGSGAPAGISQPAGSNGQNSTAFGLTAVGGGGGASEYGNNNSPAGSGGSGGGAASHLSTTGGLGTAGQGNNGGNSGGSYYPGGGGGAGAVGTSTPANGGVGLPNDILGTSYYWAGGGGGAGYSGNAGNGGLGGAGGGAPKVGGGGLAGGSGYNAGTDGEVGSLNAQTNKRGGSAGVNTGSGGGGGSHYNVTNEGGSGGSGIAVVRYFGAQRATGGTVTTVGTDTVHTFTTSGILTIPTSAGLTASTTNAYWGDTITILLQDNVVNGTNVAYTITGVTSAQINNASLTGNFTVNDGVSSLSIVLSPQSSVATATMVITTSSYSTSININYLIDVRKSLTTVGTNWGRRVVFSAITRGLSNGTQVPYTISGVTTQQIGSVALTGNLISYGSVVFDGSGDNLLIPYNSIFHLDADFTIELWLYPIATGGMILNMAGGTGIANASFELVWDGSNVNFAASSNNSSYNIGSETGATGRLGAVSLNTWTHIAVTRKDDTYRGFLNGILGYSQTVALTPYNPNTRGIAIGSNYATTWGTGTPTNSINGHISNLRILKNLALYTSAFTPPTNPLPVTESTVLLACHGSTVTLDSSRYNHTLAVNGNSAISFLSPFLSKSATLSLTTNANETFTNTANMSFTVNSTSSNVYIASGTTAIINNRETGTSTLTYNTGNINDVHGTNLEATTSSVSSTTVSTFGTTINPAIINLEFIDTESTDVHKLDLENKLSTTANTTTNLVGNINSPQTITTAPAATYSVTSDNEVKVTPVPVQNWSF